MQFFRRAILLGLTAAGIALPIRRDVGRPALPAVGGGSDPSAARKVYTANDAEYYMTADQVGYIRPGFHITLNSLTNVAAGQKPVADVSFTDDFGQPLDYLGNATPGPLTVGFVLSWYDAGIRQYTPYTFRTRNGVTAPNVDQNGTWNHIALGHSQYTFGTVLPSSLDPTKTHTLAIQGKRTLTPIIGKDYFADNVIFNFRPDNGTVTDVWDAMDVNKTCNNCHDPLNHHGGVRRDVKMCVLCHTPIIPNNANGQPYDFKVMIHRIHDASNLPSVKAGGTYKFDANDDFTTVVFPQDIRNCTKCHRNDSPQGFVYNTYPARAACGSCHDDVNFATGANHAGGIQLDDTQCATCHQPQGVEFDASVIGAHTIPLKSTQLAGLNAQILSVTNSQPGQNPTITFKITNNDGSVVDPSTLGSNANIVIGGPTVEYSLAVPFRESVAGASFNGIVATYTMKAALPQNASGTWLASMEVRRTVTINVGSSKNSPSVTEGATNPIFYFAVTDAAPVARRSVVDINKCNVCHDRLALHGGQRFVTDECVACHNPNATDVSQRPANTGFPESISFQRMIHRIHSGENLTHDYTIYGFHGSVNNFNDVRFPGDTRDCQKCHVGTSFMPPLPLTNLPVQTPPPPQEWYTPMQTTAAACLGCHDTEEAAAHAYVMTAPFGEACAACHAADDEFAADKVHAR